MRVRVRVRVRARARRRACAYACVFIIVNIYVGLLSRMQYSYKLSLTDGSLTLHATDDSIVSKTVVRQKLEFL